MNNVNNEFNYLRVHFRQYGKMIAEDVFKRVHPATPKNTKEICVFCQSTNDLTREHVLPQWLYEKRADISMIFSGNLQKQTYHKAVVPVCQTCNNLVLSNIEKCIIQTIKKIDSKTEYSIDDMCNIIRWLEILDYKLQVYEFRRKYIKYGDSEYIRGWGEFSVAMLRNFPSMNPFLAYNQLRQSQNRIIIKSKVERIESLLFFEPNIPGFNFFNLPNEYIFLSFPMFKLAIFYFLRRHQSEINETYNEAYEIMTQFSNN